MTPDGSCYLLADYVGTRITFGSVRLRRHDMEDLKALSCLVPRLS